MEIITSHLQYPAFSTFYALPSLGLIILYGMVIYTLRKRVTEHQLCNRESQYSGEKFLCSCLKNSHNCPPRHLGKEILIVRKK